MKKKKILSAIIATAISFSALSSYATAWTKPEYSFDVDSLLHKSCSLCNKLNYNEPADSDINPNCIMIVMKGEYSYPKSVWTAEDFPELAELGIEIDYVTMISDFSSCDDAWLEDYLLYTPFHNSISIHFKEEYQTIENVRAARNAILEATLAGKHPEFAAIDFNTSGGYGILLMGDVNVDGTINAVDVTLAARYIVGDRTETIAWELLDVNSDRKFNATDVTLISRYVVGIIDSFDDYRLQ